MKLNLHLCMDQITKAADKKSKKGQDSGISSN